MNYYGMILKELAGEQRSYVYVEAMLLALRMYFDEHGVPANPYKPGSVSFDAFDSGVLRAQKVWLARYVAY